MRNRNITSIYETLLKTLLLFLIIFIPYREILSLYISSKVKILPDMMIIFTLALYIIKNNFRIKLNSTDIIYGVFLVVAFISTVFVNHVGIKSFIVQTRSITLYYIVYFMLRDNKLDSKFYRAFSKVIIYNTIILTSLGFIEKITSKTVLFPEVWAKPIAVYADNFARVYGVFSNPNTFGAYLLFTMVIIFYLERYMSIKVNRLFYIFSLSGIILTGSRSSIIALGLFIVTYFVLFKSKKLMKNTVLNILIAILIVFCINNLSVIYPKIIMSTQSNNNVHTGNPNSVINRFSELSNVAIISKSKANGRVYSIITGIEIFKSYPIIGTGFGTYGDAASLIITPKLYEKYDIDKEFYADNEYIKVLVETGIIGTIVYFLFLVSIMSKYRNDKLKIVACVMVGFLGLFYNTFEVQILAFLFWVLLTIPEEKSGYLKG